MTKLSILIIASIVVSIELKAQITTDTGGNVGIGTTSPSTKLSTIHL